MVDNCTEFDKKIARVLQVKLYSIDVYDPILHLTILIQAVCTRIGLNYKGVYSGNQKRKFLLKSLPDQSVKTLYFTLILID